ncbi:bifunctional tRNA (5-methylaminomethyl-2-thiouridine)(34)-methyltransferase MnmD/FAD-dependent 5-carboxymethylaminomethyl-2-thiouridine(34) oxidoreductase MnmC [Azohydromonas caseinilytica]|uniref:tRNA 5-methylaminomethyl-2-thiouridine biosynthesis bifunctional protein MnmC n=1 Tax=Azohydromonas caseinilytica TaxID=2728836 RepID=A0A848F587_9BURK|nr:bifunctional tRNA (5-methylaminomethyl-2-thiouridine)(34)-methyltransferase MnmD/FAD-dependent 5-carboxymethylaminomethyl-2-thiouridine(34) oxidoreductase MnmC [Azohydromonas caseinilytica]NML14562.1 bifunctional tRNA (5-methylaminomethyl-2-thiouridine)(34)-methyltransferase MnmD/FAD-dependent 5-carboxymethylaminomethyl-2-thiouridine(34) oxidoreductase MnmC [Azohydromonas caseinilytica]
MKRFPIAPARIEFDAQGVPHAPDFGDVYHARAGAQAQARHVFLQGNGLPQRWQGRTRFVILETGFGLGNNFLATWEAWRADAQRCGRLHYVAIDLHPPRLEDLRRAHAASALPELAAELMAAWPPLSPDLHTLHLDGGRVVLQLAWGDATQWLPQLLVEADAFYLDGFAPARNEALWSAQVFKPLGRLAAPGATAATWSVARPVRDGLRSAGFEVERAPGFDSKREMTRARYAPVFVPRRAAGHPLSARVDSEAPRTALVIGAGLAGAACAQALAAAGWHCTVLERHAEPASETSGNRGGLFHGVVNGQDGPHARFNRAAALLAQRTYAPLIHGGHIPGQLGGLLRLAGADASLEAMHALLATQGLPADYVQPLTPEAASERSGLPLREPAWLYPGGGWLQPGALVRHWLNRPGIALRTGVEVKALCQREGGAWSALDAVGQKISQASAVVLANAGQACTLLRPLLGDAPTWPLGLQRGQVTLVPADTPGLRRPRLPVAGGGYALTLQDDSLVCGATASLQDLDPALRAEDQAFNLQRLRRLGIELATQALPLAGRVGWRTLADDRLPVVGAVPQPGASAQRVRELPRMPGLFVCTALASRGIGWAPLLGELIAAWVGGGPFPLEAELVEAVDPARFGVRRARKAPAETDDGA